MTLHKEFIMDISAIICIVRKDHTISFRLVVITVRCIRELTGLIMQIDKNAL